MKKLTKVFSVIALALCVVLLAGCAPKDVDAAKKKMEKAGYNVLTAVTLDEPREGVVGNITGASDSISSLLSGDAWEATLYESAKAAKEAYGDGGKNSYLVGKWIFVGSEESYKAFK